MNDKTKDLTPVKKKNLISNLDLDPKYINPIPLSIPYERVKQAFNNDNIAELLGIYGHFLRFDTQISSEIQKRRVSLSRLPFMVESEDKNQQSYLEKLTSSSGFRKLLFEASAALPYGFACFVTNWEFDNLAYFPKLNYISPKFISSKNNELYISMGFHKVYLKDRPDVWVYAHPTDSGDLAQQSLMYRVIGVASLKYIALSKYMSYLDSLSIPPLVVKADSVDNEEDLEKMMEMLYNLRSNSIGIFGKNDVLELLNGNVDKGTFLEFLNYCDEAISKLITGQVLAGNSVDRGTQALGNVHNKILKSTEEFDAALLSEGMRALIQKALALNFKNIAPFKFELDTNTESDENEQMEVFLKLKQIGVDVPLEHLENTFKIKGLSRSEQDMSNLVGRLSIDKNAREDNKLIKTPQARMKAPSLPLTNLEASDNQTRLYDEEIENKVVKILQDSRTYEDAYNEIVRQFDDESFNLAEEALFDLMGNAEIKGSIDGIEEVANG